MKKSSLSRQTRPVITALLKKHGARCRPDITEGVNACARIWDFKRHKGAAFRDFCVQHYVPPGEAKEQLLRRLDPLWRTITGGIMLIRKESRAGLDMADMPLTPAESLLGAFTAGSHLQEDYRTFQIAHLVQLNFGTDRKDPPGSRLAWAARRLGEWGRDYVPAHLLAEASQLHAEVDKFVSSYNLYLDKIDFGDPRIQFPDNTRLISHWGLRDYMMELYDDPQALLKQRAILGLMERVVDGQIPAEILDNPQASWHIPHSTVQIGKKIVKTKPHGPLRWAEFRKLFQITRKIDPYTRYGNMIDQKFLEERELAEPRVRKILTDILSSDVAVGVGKFLEQKFNRPLEPFDIYFKDFAAGATRETLPVAIAKRYPTKLALQAAIPDVLVQLGFDRAEAQFIGSKIRVDNGRSAGHAWSPGFAHDLQLLRVRVPDEGISEIEFSTYMHELGHCVEGVLSSYRMDYHTLWGVPNSAITEAFAFTFQDRADLILGRAPHDQHDVVTLQRFWEAFEIAGPALVEIDFFHWLYKHPNATAAQMQQAIRDIGDAIWKKYHRRIFGPKSYGLPSVYSHILWCDLYLADYPLGYVCAYQIRRHLKNKSLGVEMPRMCAAGAIYPDEWMKNAVGRPIEAEPLLADTAAALRALKI